MTKRRLTLALLTVASSVALGTGLAIAGSSGDAYRAGRAGSTVQIAGFAFRPATLRTKEGSVVTWRNSDAAPHTATGRQISSPQLGKGVSFRKRFSRAGTYTYLCALHPGMRGKVIVAKQAAP